MPKKLVVVESPAKAKTVNKMLGAEYLVRASLGHVRDLPERTLGVDVQKNFEPVYVMAKGKKKVIDELRRAARDCEAVYLAPDPDREGEAIAWHIEELLKPGNPNKPFYRVQYNEITPAAVRRAFERPGAIDSRRVNAQQARRILDRLVGYMVSPMLWRKIRRGLSAGRVQSVALRLVCEREEEIRRFVPEAYWILGAKARKLVAPLNPFTLRLMRIDDEKANIRSAEDAERIRKELESRRLRVAEVAVREVTRRPLPPLITSSLQQAASSLYGFAPKRTMALAQKLYEGVDLGEGPVGLITYMRTDSFNIAAEALDACRTLIRKSFGPEYCPERPNVYRSRDLAQEAHEAIRPTDVRRTPESVASHLDPSELKLYRLIWQRFVASQMTPARFDQRTVKVDAVAPAAGATRYQLQASASDLKFPGHLKVMGAELKPKTEPGSKTDAEPEQRLPPLAVGEDLECLEWLSERKETQPPPRYSEASLVKALEGNGIGRPSTYAQIIATLEQRRYVSNEKRVLTPTELGMQVNALLVASLDALFNVAFTAAMEERLDLVEQGKIEWTRMLEDFYKQFQEWMKATQDSPADAGAVGRLLQALGAVREWAPPVRSGKRVFSDEKFVESVRRQAADGKRQISPRQLAALARIAARYRAQSPALEAALRETGFGALLDEAAETQPRESSLKRLAVLKDLPLGERARSFVDSLQARADAGRPLTPAQQQALGRVVLSHAAQIPDFDARRAELELEQPAPAEDRESGPLLEALAGVRQWHAPVTRGRRVFDDKAFFESLAEQYRRRRSLSDRQRAALKKLTARYRAQIPHFDRLAEQYGLALKPEAPAEPAE